MSDFITDLNIWIYWFDRPVRGGEFLEQTQLFLRKVMLAFPKLSNLKVVRNPKKSNGIVMADFSNFDEQVIASLPKDWTYINSDDSNKKFTIDSTPAICFSSAFILSSEKTAEKIFFSISAGSMDSNRSNNLIIEISPELESSELAKYLLSVCVEFWRPDNAFVGRCEVLEKLNQPVGDKYVGWLTYLADAEARDALPDDIRVEPFHNGILIQATEQPGYGDDTEGIETMRRILAALGPILKNP